MQTNLFGFDDKEYIKFNIPQNATKQLAIQSCSAGRKVVVSTNWLKLFGFEKGYKVVEELISTNNGIRVRLANKEDKKVKMVYEREYKKRKENPLETQFDIRGQKLLNEAFPKQTKMVHVTFKHGLVEIRPILNKVYEAIQRFKKLSFPLAATLACSSGIDGYSLEKNGFQIDTLIEYRPHEKRDCNDLTETGALNAITNLKVNHLINEDIMNLDLQRLAELTNSSTNTLFHISLQCDDFTNVKANSLKEKSLNDGSTTLDMVFDAIDYIKTFMPPTILVENVKGFIRSDAGKMLEARLKRYGYQIKHDILRGRDYGGLTLRERYYLVATLLPFEFEMPKSTTLNTTPIWDKYIEPYIVSGEARDVTNSKSLQTGLLNGRIRLIERSSLFAPTILKSQSRMANDSVVIRDEKRNGKLFFPSNEMMVKLMSIPTKIDFRAVTKSIASEIIGQSVEYLLHDALIKNLKEYLISAHASLNMTKKGFLC